MAKIIVFGATGSVGSEVAKALAQKNIPFRAVVRDANKADQLKKLADNVEIAQVDLYNPESVGKALEGIEKVFMLTPPGQTELTGFTLVDAIKKAGTVKHIVKLSALGVGIKDSYKWATQHEKVEDYARQTGIPLTCLRPTCFYSNLYMDIHSIKSEGILYYSLGNSKMNWIGAKDIGECAAAALIEGEKHYGKNYSLTGPESLTGDEAAQLIGKVLGKEVKYQAISNEELRKYVAPFFPAQGIDYLCDMFVYLAKGGYDCKFEDLEKVTGSKGQTFTEWLEQHKAAFL